MKATELLKKQHREVKALFGKAKKAKSSERRNVMDEITQKLQTHMTIEEEIFYPAVRELDSKKTEEIVPEAYEEHHVVKLVLAELPDESTLTTSSRSEGDRAERADRAPRRGGGDGDVQERREARSGAPWRARR